MYFPDRQVHFLKGIGELTIHRPTDRQPNPRAVDILPVRIRRSITKPIRTMRPWLYGPWPAALNGQRFRQSLFRSLVRQLQPQAVFESGTYCGGSTQFLWHLSGAPVYTVEKNRGFARRAMRRFHENPEVRVLNEDSRDALRRLREADRFPCSRVLFYLDAHWEKDLPLREEVDIITKTWTESIVVIDDFKVPDDDGYEFDAYGDVQLSMEYLGEEVVAPYETFWPNCVSSMESGRRRGCVVLAAPDVARQVSELPEVRHAEALVLPKRG
ncbi:hypothetical protein ACFPH6_42345 [Streptomyces xiangluensis]|uniref:Methyltransferase domain-containing protein n=1 Tax=Streptomyces xiangluensis TaxID=2665720 RepID=A0ABV8Z2D9_9ACTN